MNKPQQVERTASLELDEIFSRSQNNRMHNRRQSIDPTRFFASQKIEQPIRPKTTEPTQTQETTQQQQQQQQQQQEQQQENKEESNSKNKQEQQSNTDSLENREIPRSSQNSETSESFTENRFRSNSNSKQTLEEDEELNQIISQRNEQDLNRNIQNEYLQHSDLESDDEEEVENEDDETNDDDDDDGDGDLNLRSSTNLNNSEDSLPLDQSQIRNAVRQIFDYYSQHMSPRASPSIHQQQQQQHDSSSVQPSSSSILPNNSTNPNPDNQAENPIDDNNNSNSIIPQQPQQPNPSNPSINPSNSIPPTPTNTNDTLSIILQIRNQLILFQLDQNGAIVRHQLLDPALANAILEQHSQQADGGQISRLDLILDQMFNQSGPKPPPKAMSKVIDFLCQQQTDSDGLLFPSKRESISGSSCPICMETTLIGDGDKTGIVSMPCCHQILHQECLKSWLSNTCTCPLCRYQFPTDDKDFELERIEKMKQRSGGLLALEQTIFRPSTPA